MNKYLILKQLPGGKPTVKFIGTEAEAKSIMFHIIMNSENGFKKETNDEGYEIVVTEAVLEYASGRKPNSVMKEVTYYLYPLKEEYEEF
jgi:hypothetical protein